MNNPKTRQQWILDLLKNKPTLSYGGCFGEYSVNFGRTERTFDKDWKVAKQQAEEYQNKLQKEKLRVSIEEETKAVKRGLKTKIERLLDYQKQINKINRILDGKENAPFVLNGKLTSSLSKEGVQTLPIQMIVTLQRTLKELQSEISKIEGDYVANKIELAMEPPLFPDVKIKENVYKDNGDK